MFRPMQSTKSEDLQYKIMRNIHNNNLQTLEEQMIPNIILIIIGQILEKTQNASNHECQTVLTYYSEGQYRKYKI